MTRSARLLLGDIIEAARLVQEYTSGVSFEAFESDTEKQDAVVRRIEIIGEAVKKLPTPIREGHPQVPWRDIAGARDILVHEYFRVDLELAWEMVQVDIPDLLVQLRLILAGLDD